MILLHAELGGLFPLGAKLGYISSQSLDLTGAGIFLIWRHASLPGPRGVAVDPAERAPRLVR